MQKNGESCNTNDREHGRTRRLGVTLFEQDHGKEQGCCQGESNGGERQWREKISQIFYHYYIDTPEQYHEQQQRKNIIVVFCRTQIFTAVSEDFTVFERIYSIMDGIIVTAKKKPKPLPDPEDGQGLKQCGFDWNSPV